MIPHPNGTLNDWIAAIQVLIIDRVFIMPDAGRWVRHLVGNERAAIDSRRGLDRVDGRSRPGIDGRSHAHRGANRRKGEARRAADIETAVGDVVIHVALPRVGLAPGVLMRGDVLRFGDNRSRPDSGWYSGRSFRPELDAWGPRSSRCGRCDLCAVEGKTPVNGLTQAREPRPLWLAFKLAPYGSEQPGRETTSAGGTAKAAGVAVHGGEGMLQPGLANLFEALVVGRSAAHPIEILRNDRMIGVGHRKPIQRDVSVIAGGRSDRHAHLGSVAAKLLRGSQIPDDDIRSRHEIRNLRVPPRREGGRIDDCTAPLTIVVISIGYMVVDDRNSARRPSRRPPAGPGCSQTLRKSEAFRP